MVCHQKKAVKWVFNQVNGGGLPLRFMVKTLFVIVPQDGLKSTQSVNGGAYFAISQSDIVQACIELVTLFRASSFSPNSPTLDVWITGRGLIDKHRQGTRPEC